VWRTEAESCADRRRFAAALRDTASIGGARPEAAAPPNWSTPPSLACCAPALRRPSRCERLKPRAGYRGWDTGFSNRTTSPSNLHSHRGGKWGLPPPSGLVSREPPTPLCVREQESSRGIFGRSLRSRAKTRPLVARLFRKPNWMRALLLRPVPFRLWFAPFPAQSRPSRSILPFHRAPAAHRAGSVPESARSCPCAHRQLRHGDCNTPRQPFRTRGHRR